MSQNACVALTIVNVEYSEFMNLLKDQNELRTLTRSTFVHTPNRPEFASHPLVLVKDMFFLTTTIKTFTRL